MALLTTCTINTIDLVCCCFQTLKADYENKMSHGLSSCALPEESLPTETVMAVVDIRTMQQIVACCSFIATVCHSHTLFTTKCIYVEVDTTTQKLAKKLCKQYLTPVYQLKHRAAVHSNDRSINGTLVHDVFHTIHEEWDDTKDSKK